MVCHLEIRAKYAPEKGQTISLSEIKSKDRNTWLQNIRIRYSEY